MSRNMTSRDQEPASSRRPFRTILGVLGLVALAAWVPWSATGADAQDQRGAGLIPADWLPSDIVPEDAGGQESMLAGASGIEADRDVDTLLKRALALENAWGAVEDVYSERVAPIERVLLRYRNDPELARRVALALVREARRAGIEPRVLLAVLLVENPWIDPTARSFVGAVGLMQVMPLHRGHWGACGDDLESIESNICHGAQIFAHYFRRAGGNIERALLRYNGCVNGTNTPNCHRYPYHVYARAGRASMIAWLGADPESTASGAASP